MVILLLNVLFSICAIQGVADSSGVKFFSVGWGNGDYSIMLKDDGTVWTWGHNDLGQLGDGSASDRSMPRKVPIDNITEIAAGISHIIALKDDGTVWTWGSNFGGEHGDGTIDNNPLVINRPRPSLPGQVLCLNGIKSIAAGGGYSLAIKEDGTVWAWGSNLDGCLGDGTNESRPIPIQVKGLSDINAVSADGRHSLALDNKGRVWAWGSNTNGQLGDGTTINRYTPVLVPIDNVKTIVAGIGISLALKGDGTVWAWGDNSFSQLGDGTQINKLNPVQVNGLSNIVEIGTGGTFSIALKNDGSLWTWGNNELQAGMGIDKIIFFTPYKIPLITNVKSMSVSMMTIMVLKNDGTLWAWGHNQYGELGDGTFSNGNVMLGESVGKYTPTKVMVDSNIDINVTETPTNTITPDTLVNDANNTTITPVVSHTVTPTNGIVRPVASSPTPTPTIPTPAISALIAVLIIGIVAYCIGIKK